MLNEGYSKLTLQPKNSETAAVYKEFTRTMVQRSALRAFFPFLLYAIIALTLVIKNKDFKKLSETVSANAAYFLLFGALAFVTSICLLLSQRCLVAVELIIPIYAFFVFLIALPSFYENRQSGKLYVHEGLAALQNGCYITEAALVYFFTATYWIGLPGRWLLALVSLNNAIRRVQNGLATLLPTLFNWTFLMIQYELLSYSINEEKVIIFLEKEKHKQQEKQTRQILQSIPTSILIVQDGTILFKNLACDNLIDSLSKELCEADKVADLSFDKTKYFYEEKIFEFYLKYDPANLFI